MYAKRTPPDKPPCEACRVVLLPENEEAAEVFMMCRGQHITQGEKGIPVDISIVAIKTTMDLMGIEVANQRQCLARVRGLWHHINNERQKDEG